MGKSSKTFILILTFFLCPIYSYSQDYNLTFYSVGFISDYMGRRIEKGDSELKNSVDNFFHQSNLYDLVRLDTLLKLNNLKKEFIPYQIKKREGSNNCSNCHEFFDLNSKLLCQRINRFYNFKKDKLNSDEKIQRYIGKLKVRKILFSKKNNLISFMAGAFYTYGDKDSIGYYYRFGNSVEKQKVVRRLLERFDCKIIKEFDNQEEGSLIAPLINTIYFIPTTDLKIRFDYEIKIKKELKELMLTGTTMGLGS